MARWLPAGDALCGDYNWHLAANIKVAQLKQDHAATAMPPSPARQLQEREPPTSQHAAGHALLLTRVLHRRRSASLLAASWLHARSPPPNPRGGLVPHAAYCSKSLGRAS